MFHNKYKEVALYILLMAFSHQHHIILLAFFYKY